jgi:uncharacterized protein (TIGR02145 family)
MWSVDGSNNYSSGVARDTITSSVPVVSNVTFINNISTTGYVDIYYDITDAEQNQVTISMEVSNDGGTTYNYSDTLVTGDIGSGISVGNGKHIIWDFDREHNGVFGSNFKIKIIADNNLGNQIYYAGKIYNTVTIGTQIWLQENLDVGTMINGISDQTNNAALEKYCYNDDPANCTTYGGLYQWGEAMQYVTTEGAKGICPTGWHIPDTTEFRALSITVLGDGNLLKAVGQGESNGAGTNISGFSAVVGGSRGLDGTFSNLTVTAYIWSSTPGTADPTIDNFFILHGWNSDALLSFGYKNYGFSVRCLKN